MNTTSHSKTPVALWLFACAALIFCMVILGGVTRLTDSGLSMVHWKPITGVIPPISESEWRAEMAHYKESPEYQKINRGLSLDDFKSIFYFEWAHRVLGRLIGIAFFVPFVWFLWRGNITRRESPRYIGLFILGGLQGLLGWYMVKSGLVDNPHVSQYRLAAHLLLAIVIYGFILWVAMSLWRGKSGPAPLNTRPFRQATQGLLALAFLTVFSGALVAGLDAGMIYNTFPKMGHEWIPTGIDALSPAYLNLFENKVTVQFDHRILALLTATAILLYGVWAQKQPAGPAIAASRWAMIIMVLIQVALGITTLLLQVPVWAGALHQAGALILLSLILWHWHSLSLNNPPD